MSNGDGGVQECKGRRVTRERVGFGIRKVVQALFYMSTTVLTLAENGKAAIGSWHFNPTACHSRQYSSTALLCASTDTFAIMTITETIKEAVGLGNTGQLWEIRNYTFNR